MNQNNRTPNFFWPVIFIGAGAILLFSNLGLYEFEVLDLVNIARLWPLLLVAIGVNLLFGRNRSWIASIFSLVLGLSVVAAVVFAPSFIEPISTADYETESYVEPLDAAESAKIKLDFDRGNLEVFRLDDSSNLLEAKIVHNQDLEFSSSGTSQRNISIRLDQINRLGIFDWLEENQTVSEVGLTAELPIDLFVDLGSAKTSLDLEGLNLTDLEVKSGSGSIMLIHPEKSVTTVLGAGSGSIEIRTLAGSELDLTAEAGSGRIRLYIAEGVFGKVELQAGSGSLRVYVPEGTALRVRGSTGSGGVSVPNDFDRVSGSDRVTGDSGTWQSPDYADADQRLEIEFSVGSGSFGVVYE